MGYAFRPLDGKLGRFGELYAKRESEELTSERKQLAQNPELISDVNERTLYGIGGYVLCFISGIGLVSANQIKKLARFDTRLEEYAKQFL